MRKLIRVAISLGDKHLGAGDARLEDFPQEIERAYLAMLKTHTGVFGPDVEYDLVFLGDWLDLLAAPFNGEYGVVPTEEAAVAKAEAILRAHPGYFSGLREFLLRYPKLSCRIIPGNHDMEMRWPRVRELIERALAPLEPSGRVTFHEDGWPVGETVLHLHGHAFDPWNADPPIAKAFKKTVMLSRRATIFVGLLALVVAVIVSWSAFSLLPAGFRGRAIAVSISAVSFIIALRSIPAALTPWFGKKVKILNVRLASCLHASLGMWLKRHYFRDINRRADHGATYAMGFARQPQSIFHILLRLCLVVVIVAGVDVLQYFRDGLLRLWESVIVVLNTMGPDRYEKHLRAFLDAHPRIRHLVGAHTHGRKVETYPFRDRTVMYYNSGLAGLEVRTFMPEVRCRTRWTPVETFFRHIGYHWVHVPRKACAVTAGYALLSAGLFLLLVVSPLAMFRWPVVTLVILHLLWRQATAEYRDETSFRLAPVETLVYQEEDGTTDVHVRLLHYDHQADRFFLPTGEAATWNHV